MIIESINDMLYDQSVGSQYASYIMEARRNRLVQSKPNVEEIVRAIERRKYVGIFYEEDDGNDVLSGFRLIEPYVYGKGYIFNGKTIHPDRAYIRAFVIKATKSESNKQLQKIKRKSVSKSKHVPYWRLFRLDRVKSWQQLRFTIPSPRPLYNPSDKMVADIITAAKFK